MIQKAQLHKHAVMASAKTYGPIPTIVKVVVLFVRKDKDVVLKTLLVAQTSTQHLIAESADYNVTL